MLSKETIYLDGDNNVIIEVLDARSIKLTFNAKPLDVAYNGRNISGIYVSNLPYLTIGEFDNIYANIADRIHVYKIQQIEKLSDNCFNVHTEKRTKASFFITPLIGKCRDDFMWGKYFVNTYLTSDNKVATLFRFFNIEDYKVFESSLRKHKLFHKMKDYDLQHVLFMFNQPDTNDIVDKFLQGKYSSMPDEYKEKILNFHNLQKTSEVGKVLFKSEERRKQLELELGVKIPLDVDLYDKPGESEIIKI